MSAKTPEAKSLAGIAQVIKDVEKNANECTEKLQELINERVGALRKRETELKDDIEELKKEKIRSLEAQMQKIKDGWNTQVQLPGGSMKKLDVSFILDTDAIISFKIGDHDPLTKISKFGAVSEERREFVTCIKHGKRRSLACMEQTDDGWVCKEDRQCGNSGSGGTKRAFCRFFRLGKCKNGDGCAFAHTKEEIGAEVIEDLGTQSCPVFSGFGEFLPENSANLKLMSGQRTPPPPGLEPFAMSCPPSAWLDKAWQQRQDIECSMPLPGSRTPPPGYFGGTRTPPPGNFGPRVPLPAGLAAGQHTPPLMPGQRTPPPPGLEDFGPAEEVGGEQEL